MDWQKTVWAGIRRVEWAIPLRNDRGLTVGVESLDFEFLFFVLILLFLLFLFLLLLLFLLAQLRRLFAIGLLVRGVLLLPRLLSRCTLGRSSITDRLACCP